MTKSYFLLDFLEKKARVVKLLYYLSSVVMKKITCETFQLYMESDSILDFHFYWVNFTGYDFSWKQFTHCIFEKCNLSNIPLLHTWLNDVVFLNCKILGGKFVEVNQFLMSLRFEGCSISLTSFYWVNLKNTRFEDCEIKETDFSHANLEKARFLYCDLEKSLFFRTNLKQTDFSGSMNFSINPNDNILHKTRFSQANCVGLLHHLDIILE